MGTSIKKTLLMLVVALIAVVPQVNAQNGRSGMRRQGSSTSTTKKQQPKQQAKPKSSSQQSSRRHVSSRSNSAPPKRSGAGHAMSRSLPVYINSYWANTQARRNDGLESIQFHVDFSVRNRQGRKTSIRISAFKGDNETPILNSLGQPLYTYFDYVPRGDLSERGIVDMYIVYYDLVNSVNWNPKVDGITFDLEFLDEYGNTIAELCDLDYD